MRLTLVFAAAAGLAMCSASPAQITGQATLKGKPPKQFLVIQNPDCAAAHKNLIFGDTVLVGKNNELQNVIVFVKESTPGEFKGRQLDKPAVLDQKGCMFSPHVLAVQTGQPVLIRNSDPLLHDVHTLSLDNDSFNIAQLQGGQEKHTFDKPEEFPIKCDIHPWMAAVIRVFDHPYFAVTDAKGRYTIDTKGLKDGTYTVVAWHQHYHKSQPQKVQIKGGKASKAVDFSIQ